MISDEIISVVADIGHLNCRFGFTGDDFPRWSTQSSCTDTFEFGDEYLGIRPAIDIMHPSINFDLYERLLRAAYSKGMRVSEKEYGLLLANNFANKQELQKATEIIFESLEIPNFFTIRNAALATFSAGRPSALVLDIGAYQTTAVGVHDGYTLLKTQISAQIGGEHLNEYFKNLVPQISNEYKYLSLVRDVKKQLLASEGDGLYEMPDGTTVKMSQNELANIQDKFFQPSERCKGIASMVIDVINSSHVDLKQIFSTTILATGGSSNIAGFLANLNQKITVQAPQSKAKMVSYPTQQNREHSVFIGGSILASLSSFQSMWVSKSEYQESGKFTIVERKCPM